MERAKSGLLPTKDFNPSGNGLDPMARVGLNSMTVHSKTRMSGLFTPLALLVTQQARVKATTTMVMI